MLWIGVLISVLCISFPVLHFLHGYLLHQTSLFLHCFYVGPASELAIGVGPCRTRFAARNPKSPRQRSYCRTPNIQIRRSECGCWRVTGGPRVSPLFRGPCCERKIGEPTQQRGLAVGLIERPAETNENQTAPTEGAVPVSTASGETMQTASFFDETSGEFLSFPEPTSSVFKEDAQMGVDLGNFLSRPTLIKTFSWLESGFGETSFDPWTLFLSNAQIKNKLNNFAFLQGNLKLKVVMNAAPFYYGALLMAYTPLPNFATSIASTPNKYIAWSQRPHIWIYPQNNAGGELSLPFLYPENFVDLTSAADVATLGSIKLLQYTTLASANGATSNGVTIQIYAWMENPVLTGPTVKLALQSGDEYGNGPISAPATAVAHWSKYLSKVPYIGRLAKATGIGASAVSQVAKLFGWTNVPVIEDVKPMKNLPWHDLSSAQDRKSVV